MVIGAGHEVPERCADSRVHQFDSGHDDGSVAGPLTTTLGIRRRAPQGVF
jgi:hypothetical protein